MWEIQVQECSICKKRMGIHRPRRMPKDNWTFWTDFIELREAITYSRKTILITKMCDCHFRIYNTETQEVIPFELFG